MHANIHALSVILTHNLSEQMKAAYALDYSAPVPGNLRYYPIVLEGQKETRRIMVRAWCLSPKFEPKTSQTRSKSHILFGTLAFQKLFCHVMEMDFLCPSKNLQGWTRITSHVCTFYEV
jgi:hypothetical protein